MCTQENEAMRKRVKLWMNGGKWVSGGRGGEVKTSGRMVASESQAERN
jgi:hypothetical protein